MEEEVVPTSVEVGEEKPEEKTEPATPTEPEAPVVPEWFNKPLPTPQPQPVPQPQWTPPPPPPKRWDWDAVISDPEGYRESLKAEAKAEQEASLMPIKQALVGMYQETQMREIAQAEKALEHEIARVSQDAAYKTPAVASMMQEFFTNVRVAARNGDPMAKETLKNPYAADLALEYVKRIAAVPNTGSVSFKGGKVESGPTAANPQRNAKTISPDRAAYFKKWNIPQNEWTVEDPEAE